MRYIVFGAGETGKRALYFLSTNRVLCFADNYTNGGSVLGKDVVSFQEMLELSKNNIIVIASEIYYEKMERQLLEQGVNRYFVFHEAHPNTLEGILPKYQLYGKSITVDYAGRLSYCGISKYKKVAIYGTNTMLPYLISEIYIQNPECQIVEIISDELYDKKAYMGIPCVRFEDASGEYECMVINKLRCHIKYPEILEKETIQLIDIYTVDEMVPEFKHLELAKFRGIHRGQRIWLIGNGPSLRIEDLEKLYEQGEICIAFNKIYKAYHKMKWRPDYFAITDPVILEGSVDDIPHLGGEIFLRDYWHSTTITQRNLGDIHYFHMSYYDFYPNKPQFSDDITNGVICGHSVVYDVGIQLAVYMGAKEIYLLGIDHHFPANGVTDENAHFIKDYLKSAEKEQFKKHYQSPEYMLARSTKAFEAAKWYADKHEIRIFNATRGGELEVFERIDFDLFFQS